MNKKTLILVIIVLAVVLVAGLVAVIAMSGANDNNDPASNVDVIQPDNHVAATDDPVQGETDAPADPVPGESNAPAAPVQPEDNEPEEPEDPVVTGPTLDMSDPEVNGSSDVPNLPESSDKPAPEKEGVTYLDYHSMSADQQKAFINSFGSYDAFFEWHDAAKKAYEDSLIELDGTTPVDMEEITGGN